MVIKKSTNPKSKTKKITLAKLKKVETMKLSSSKAKVVAVVSYLTPIGWLIAFLMNLSNKTRLGRFHLRQALLLMLIMIAMNLFGIIGGIVQFIGLVFLIMGLISAAQGKYQELPVVGKYAQDWFKGL